MKRGQFQVPAVYSTGTLSATNNSATIDGVGTVWTSAMIGRQLVVSGYPIYTITAVDIGGLQLTIDAAWGAEAISGSTYQIYKCYYSVPTDFHSFMTIWDVSLGIKLGLGYTQAEMASIDPERTNTGDAYLAAAFDYYVPTGETVAVPRYELWPHPTAQRVYPYLYETRPTDLEDSGATLPRFLHGDVLLEMALEQAALWPGPSEEKKNPYFSTTLATMHRNRAEQLIMEMERQDEEVFSQNVQYQEPEGLFLVDADFLQSHAF